MVILWRSCQLEGKFLRIFFITNLISYIFDTLYVSRIWIKSGVIFKKRNLSWEFFFSFSFIIEKVLFNVVPILRTPTIKCMIENYKIYLRCCLTCYWRQYKKSPIFSESFPILWFLKKRPNFNMNCQKFSKTS